MINKTTENQTKRKKLPRGFNQTTMDFLVLIKPMNKNKKSYLEVSTAQRLLNHESFCFD